MYKKTITYNDYNDLERTEDFYFNLSKAELMEMQLTTEGGFVEKIKAIAKAKDTPTLTKIFKNLILASYGEKSDDGKRFVKSDEITKAFTETEAYSILFMELISDSESAAEFVNNIIPSDLKVSDEEIKEALKSTN